MFALSILPKRDSRCSPFEIIFSKNVHTPLELVNKSWIIQGTNKKQDVEWVEDLYKRLDLIKDILREKMGKAKQVLKKDYDKCAKTRIFENGDLVLIRIPGMTNKLSESWEGPYEILEKVSAANYAISVPGKNKRGKVIHVNNTKKFVQSTAHVLRLVVAADDDEVELEKKVALIGDKLEEEQLKDLGKSLNKWKDILSKKPWHLLLFNILLILEIYNQSDLCLIA